MTDYLDYHFEDTPAFVSTFDELPLWSAPFGLLLLKHLELKPGLTVIDAGFGTGFPLMELAARMGKTCRFFGIDPWVNAAGRARQKMANYGLDNMEIIEGSAAQMPFEHDHADLIVSNLGINNFEHPGAVFKECHRVIKPGGKLALTTNLNGHWKTFYDIFESTLTALGEHDLVVPLQQHQAHRGSVESISGLFTESGFEVTRHVAESFEMKFLDGTAFLNHHFIKLGWLASWKALLPEAKQVAIFAALEDRLNAFAEKKGVLCLSVPMLFMEGVKP